MKIQKTAGKLVAATYGRGVWESPLASHPISQGIYPPLHFYGKPEVNQSLFRTEIVNSLTWEANPLNSQRIIAYRVYRVTGSSRILLKETNANTFSYWDRRMNPGIYRYILVAVDTEGNESDPLYLSIWVE
jgi:hypothetical protein